MADRKEQSPINSDLSRMIAADGLIQQVRAKAMSQERFWEEIDRLYDRSPAAGYDPTADEDDRWGDRRKSQPKPT